MLNLLFLPSFFTFDCKKNGRRFIQVFFFLFFSLCLVVFTTNISQLNLSTYDHQIMMLFFLYFYFKRKMYTHTRRKSLKIFSIIILSFLFFQYIIPTYTKRMLCMNMLLRKITYKCVYVKATILLFEAEKRTRQVSFLLLIDF